MVLLAKPKIVSYREMKAISYSELYSMRECTLQGFLKSRVVVSNYPVFKTVTSDLICGYIFHALMKDLPKYFRLPKHTRRIKVRSDVENYIDEYSTKHTSFDFSDYRYWPKLAKAIDSVININKDERSINDAIGRELRITTSDAKTTGVIDLIERTTEGIQVVDYKSRSDPGGLDIPEKYIQQLHFYALLIKDKYGMYPSKGFIEYFDSKRVPVLLDYQTSTTLHHKARSIYSRVESVIKGEKDLALLANQSANSCSGCTVSYLCPVLHSTILMVQPASVNSMIAKVVGGQDNRLELEVESGMTCSDSRVILKLTPGLIAELVQGNTYLFTNLVFLRDDKYELSGNARVYLN